MTVSETKNLKLDLPKGVNGDDKNVSTKETRETKDQSNLKGTDLYSLAAQGAYPNSAGFQNYDGFSSGETGSTESLEEKGADEQIKEGESSQSEAKGWTSKCKQFTENAKDSVTKMLGFDKKMKTQGKTMQEQVDKNSKEIENNVAEKDEKQSEIQELESEKETLMAEAGSQQQPAMAPTANLFQMSAPQGGQQGNGSGQMESNSQPQGNSLAAFGAALPPNGNESRIAEIDSEISSKSSSMNSNTTNINSLIKKSTMTATSFNKYISNVKTQSTKAQATAKDNKNGIQVAQVAGNTATTVGSGLTALGTAAQAGGFFSFGISSAVGAKLIAVGIPTTVAGGGTTAAAGFASGDVNGAIAATGNTLSQYGTSSGQYKDAMKTIKANNESQKG